MATKTIPEIPMGCAEDTDGREFEIAETIVEAYLDGMAYGRLQLERELEEAIADYAEHEKPGHACDACLVLRPAVRLGRELMADAMAGS